MSMNYIKYTSRIKSSTADGVLVEADQIKDERIGKLQSVINKENEEALDGKVEKVTGKGLSTNDYTTAEKTKLAGIEAGAQANEVTSVAGRTGAVVLGKADVGLDKVDNTADTDKPISKAAKAAFDGKVDKVAGKELSTNDYTTAEKTKLAGIEAGAQANVVTSVAGRTGAVVLGKADVGLDKVDNTADADKPISKAAKAALDGKVDKVAGKDLSTNDYTTAEKTKLGNLPQYMLGANGNPGNLYGVDYKDASVELKFSTHNTKTGTNEFWVLGGISAANAECAGVMSVEEYQALMDAKPMVLIGLANITTSSTSDDIKKMLNVETMSELFTGIFKGRRVVELTDMNMRRDVTCSLVPDVAYQGNFLATFSVIVADQYNQIDQKIYRFDISPRNNSCSLRDLKTVNLYTLSSRVAAIEDAVTLK